MTKIKFGTDGWRAIIAKEYTVENVARVAAGTAAFLKEKGQDHVVLGYDCRFAGLLFAKTAARVLCAQGIRVSMDKEFVSTPMVSLGVRELKADLGVVITASHNPPSYNGFKLKSAYGGPTIPKDIAAVEALIPDVVDFSYGSFDDYLASGQIEFVDLEQMYIDHVESNFDLQAIKDAGIGLAYDAMYGAGQNVIKRLFPEAGLLHCDWNPGFHGQAPEPIHRNLQELSDFIASDDRWDIGLANDGDADRIGLYDAHGRFVDSHHILLLLLMYMKEFKNEEGKVVVTFSVTNKMKTLADHYGLDFEVTKVGFKYIAEIMTEQEVIVGGEESGGLAVQSHIPERDGIWMGLLIMEMMAKTGKSLKALIDDVYAIVGSFAYDRDDLHVSDELKQAVIRKCKEDPFTSFGPYKVAKLEDTDGFKFTIDEDTWTMIRPSGTEPVLRVYGQASNDDEVRKLLDAVGASIRSVN